MSVLSSLYHFFSRCARGCRILWLLGRYRALQQLPQDTLPKAVHYGLHWIPPHPKVKTSPAHTHLRWLLLALGPLYIKFGQLLATRREWLSDELANDLALLQDQVPGFSPKIAKDILVAELSTPITTAFAEFHETPLASASLAQVHAAKLHSGAAVVVKILRPHIKKCIQQDLALFKWAAQLIERAAPKLQRLHLTRIAQDYESVVLKELSLLNESMQTQQFYLNFEQSADLAVPKVYPQFSTDKVLTMELMFGTPINQISLFKDKQVDLKHLAKMGVRIFLKQVFTDNFFHADMHPGNVHVDIRDPENPCYISLDNAIAGTLEPSDQLSLARQIMALIREDFYDLAKLMIRAGWVPAETSTHLFSMTLRAICAPLINQPLNQIQFGPLLLRLFSAAEQFEMRSLPQFVLLEKTLIHVEGLGAQLDPNLNIWPILQPHIEQFIRAQLSPLHLLHTLKHRFPDFIARIRFNEPSIKTLPSSPSSKNQLPKNTQSNICNNSVSKCLLIILLLLSSFLLGWLMHTN